MEKITKFVKFQRPKIVKILPKQNLMVKYDDKDQNQHISIKWHWKKLQNSKIWALENFWFLKNFEKRIKRAARLLDTLEYFLSCCSKCCKFVSHQIPKKISCWDSYRKFKGGSFMSCLTETFRKDWLYPWTTKLLDLGVQLVFLGFLGILTLSLFSCLFLLSLCTVFSLLQDALE